MKLKNKILIVILIVIVLLASHYDYECMIEDKQAIEDCMLPDTETDEYFTFN